MTRAAFTAARSTSGRVSHGSATAHTSRQGERPIESTRSQARAGGRTLARPDARAHRSAPGRRRRGRAARSTRPPARPTPVPRAPPPPPRRLSHANLQLWLPVLRRRWPAAPPSPPRPCMQKSSKFLIFHARLHSMAAATGTSSERAQAVFDAIQGWLIRAGAADASSHGVSPLSRAPAWRARARAERELLICGPCAARVVRRSPPATCRCFSTRAGSLRSCRRRRPGSCKGLSFTLPVGRVRRPSAGETHSRGSVSVTGMHLSSRAPHACMLRARILGRPGAHAPMTMRAAPEQLAWHACEWARRGGVCRCAPQSDIGGSSHGRRHGTRACSRAAA